MSSVLEPSTLPQSQSTIGDGEAPIPHSGISRSQDPVVEDLAREEEGEEDAESAFQFGGLRGDSSVLLVPTRRPPPLPPRHSRLNFRHRAQPPPTPPRRRPSGRPGRPPPPAPPDSDCPPSPLTESESESSGAPSPPPVPNRPSDVSVSELLESLKREEEEEERRRKLMSRRRMTAADLLSLEIQERPDRDGSGDGSEQEEGIRIERERDRGEGVAAVFSAEKKKKRITEEFLETERAYLKNLYILKRYFIDPLKKHMSVDPQIFDEDKFQSCFGEFEIIIPVNEMFCTDIFDAGDDRHAFLEAVFSLSHCFKLYSMYVNTYDSIAETVRLERESNEVFGFFLETRERRLRGDPNIRIANFDSYLILPIQRLPRYKLLLEQVWKEHSKIFQEMEGKAELGGSVSQLLIEEEKKLKTTLEQIEGICQYINQKRLVTRLDQMIPALAKVINIAGLMQPHRHLLKTKEVIGDRPARCALGETKHYLLSSLYLFNDIFVVLLKKGLLRGHKTIAFSLGHGVTVTKEPEGIQVSGILSRKSYDGVLRINSDAREDLQLFVAFHSVGEAEDWQAAIAEQIETITGGVSVLETELRPARGGRSTGGDSQSGSDSDDEGVSVELAEEASDQPQVLDIQRIPRPSQRRSNRRRRNKKKGGGLFRSHESGRSEEYEFAQRSVKKLISAEDLENL